MTLQTCRRARRAATAIEYGLIAAGIIVAAIAALGLTGQNLDAVFGGIHASLISSAKPLDSKYCAQDATQTNFNYWYNWGFPSYTCGKYGINGPNGPVYYQYGYYFSWSYQAYQIATKDAAGNLVPYALKMNGSENVGTGTAMTLFTDGYSMNANLVNDLGISFNTFSSICAAGGTAVENTAIGKAINTAINNPPGSNLSNSTTYGPGVPYQTAGGQFVCGYSRIVGGQNDNAPGL